jgi:glycerate kinase
MAAGWRQARPGDALELLPMSDGGDGFGSALSRLSGGKPRQVQAVDAAHRMCRARWWWVGQTGTAVIESANVIGLAMLPPKRFHPFDLDTFGLGTVLKAIAEQGSERCLLGIGGSATNDGGFGCARALGWEFLDAAGQPIASWTGLHALAELRPPADALLFKEILVAVDVQNPLLGPRGATRVYGPQKGLRPEDFAAAEKCLQRLARVARKQLGRDFASEPGAGAAGGLGFGLTAFAGARIVPGFELFAGQSRLEERIRRADLVLTGEGSLDASTLMGKGVGQVAHWCERLKRPCIALAGIVALKRPQRKIFLQVHSLVDLAGPAAAQTHAAEWLRQLANQTARSLGER